jgi:hypothetical protein
MSVDARIRQGFTMIDNKLPTVDTVEGYEILDREIRRTTHRRHAIIGAAAAAAVLVATAGGVLLNRGGDGKVEPAPPPAPMPSVVDNGSDAQAPYGNGPLDGTWQTRSLTRADIAATLREAGLNSYAQDYAASFPDGRFRLRMTSYAGNIVLRTVTGTRLQLVNREFLEPGGSTLTIRPGDLHVGKTTYRYTVEADQLTLTFLRTSAPGFGVPGEVRQRALYTTAPFTRS